MLARVGVDGVPEALASVGEEPAGHKGILEEIERLHPAFIELGQLGSAFLVQELCKGHGN